MGGAALRRAVRGRGRGFCRVDVGVGVGVGAGAGATATAAQAPDRSAAAILDCVLCAASVQTAHGCRLEWRCPVQPELRCWYRRCASGTLVV